MNELVFVSPKKRKLFGPKKLRGYFWARNSFKKCFLTEGCSVQRRKFFLPVAAQ